LLPNKCSFNSAVASYYPAVVLLQGVGVALFGDVGTANEACGQLSGVQAAQFLPASDAKQSWC
jgi:hypothetical protein